MTAPKATTAAPAKRSASRSSRSKAMPAESPVVALPELEAPKAPDGLSAAGVRLWDSVMGTYELETHEELLLLAACRIADNLDRLAAEAAKGTVTVENKRGDVVAAPAMVESRQQSQALARLMASIRLPSGEEGARPQRRGAVRGAYGVRQGA